ncbi:MAG: amtR [Labilithrix sp.]|nr:amtR [Labilithrix sp.]
MSTRLTLRKKPLLPPSEILSEPLEGTRRRILETALQLFATHGFAGTSVRDITTALELQPSAIYAHFKSKDEVLAELSRLGHAAQETALRSAFVAAPPNPVEQLRALVRTNALLHATYPHLAVVVNEELHALPQQLAVPSLAIRVRMVAMLTDVLERGIAAKEFSVGHLKVTAAAIVAMSNRIPYWYEPQADLDLETLAELQVDLALRMLGVTGSPKTVRPKGKRR